jgi:hypothetical protein
MNEPFLDRLHKELCAAAWREIDNKRRPRVLVGRPVGPLTAAAVIAVIGVIAFTAVRALPVADDAAVTPTRAHSAFVSSLTEHFTILRRAPTRRDAVPAHWSRPLNATGLHADFAGALLLADNVWVIPKGSQACLLAVPDGGGSVRCSAPPDVVGGGLFALELRPRSTDVWGLLPDGAHDITLSRSHGRPVPVTLSQGNFYSARVAGQPRKLHFTDALGKQHTVTILERSTQPTPTTIPKRPPALPTVTPTR